MLSGAFTQKFQHSQAAPTGVTTTASSVSSPSGASNVPSTTASSVSSPNSSVGTPNSSYLSCRVGNAHLHNQPVYHNFLSRAAALAFCGCLVFEFGFWCSGFLFLLSRFYSFSRSLSVSPVAALICSFVSPAVFRFRAISSLAFCSPRVSPSRMPASRPLVSPRVSRKQNPTKSGGV
jgi:hypothetical protein